jgi:hypothetical protein
LRFSPCRRHPRRAAYTNFSEIAYKHDLLSAPVRTSGIKRIKKALAAQKIRQRHPEYYGSALRGIEEKLLPLGYSPLFVSGEWNAEVETRSTRTRWTACRATAPRLVSRESCRRLSI